jgi:hypothetical protein
VAQVVEVDLADAGPIEEPDEVSVEIPRLDRRADSPFPASVATLPDVAFAVAFRRLGRRTDRRTSLPSAPSGRRLID